MEERYAIMVETFGRDAPTLTNLDDFSLGGLQAASLDGAMNGRTGYFQYPCCLSNGVVGFVTWRFHNNLENIREVGLR